MTPPCQQHIPQQECSACPTQTMPPCCHPTATCQWPMSPCMHHPAHPATAVTTLRTALAAHASKPQPSQCFLPFWWLWRSPAACLLAGEGGSWMVGATVGSTKSMLRGTTGARLSRPPMPACSASAAAYASRSSVSVASVDSSSSLCAGVLVLKRSAADPPSLAMPPAVCREMSEDMRSRLALPPSPGSTTSSQRSMCTQCRCTPGTCSMKSVSGSLMRGGRAGMPVPCSTTASCAACCWCRLSASAAHWYSTCPPSSVTRAASASSSWWRRL
mmetsp:Transcript_35558/g.89965  ORF Transcript_35558/g.89965 Transcript_35558/m.89965 type:complete len:273 (-) Transcript_35558:3930-4748(-)